MIEFIPLLVQPAVKKYLIEHEHDDTLALILKQKEILGLPASVLALQLSGRSTAKIKLPAWYTTKEIIYPPTINLEQCSSEATAKFKTTFLEEIIKNRTHAVDLTGGFGVDSYFLSNVFENTYYVEQSEELLTIAAHNHKSLTAHSIKYHLTTAEEFIESSNKNFDLVYIDPSRRDKQARKVFRLADCTPDITALQNEIFKKSNFLLVKTSPLLDIQQGLRELRFVRSVYVVSVENECKELLFLAEKNYLGMVQIEAIDLATSGVARSTFNFSAEEEREAIPVWSEPLAYLYEPNTSIMKAGAFKLIGVRYHLSKLSNNTHLYTSEKLIRDFPGRIFCIESLNPTQKELHELLPTKQANVLTRNYPLRAEELKKKLKVRDGGDKYLIGFSSEKKKYLALCSRVVKE
jgi:16S rRNA G966 N2-methylase RsmD